MRESGGALKGIRVLDLSRVLAGPSCTYRRPPPTLGQQTDEVLEEVLGLGASDRAALREANII